MTRDTRCGHCSRDGNNGTVVNESEQFFSVGSRARPASARYSILGGKVIPRPTSGRPRQKSAGGSLRPISPCDSAAQRSRSAQSGFANTDLDFQLKQHGVSHIIAVGLLANTCIESPGRFAMDFGYHVTLVRDATAAFSHEMMHAARHLNGPTFAHSILTTQELPTPSQRARQLRGSPLPEEGSHGGKDFLERSPPRRKSASFSQNIEYLIIFRARQASVSAPCRTRVLLCDYCILGNREQWNRE